MGYRVRLTWWCDGRLVMKQHHLVIFPSRTGSTLVYNWISQNLCKPAFNFYPSLYSSEINDKFFEYFLYNVKKLNDMDWCLKYQLSCGSNISNGNVNSEEAGRFFRETNVSNLHFCFRVDILDTILSDLIAYTDNSYVVNNNQVLTRGKRHINKESVHFKCQSYQMGTVLYKNYVDQYSELYDSKFYCYENLSTIFDTEDDSLGMKKQLGFEEKKNLIKNYDEVLGIIKLYDFYYGRINQRNGVLEYDK